MDFVKGIDVSAYQINVPWGVLKEHGLRWCIIKGDQMTATANHVYLARQAGIDIVGLYFWQDPTIPASAQIAQFAKDIEEYKPDFVWLDCEQWWADWDAWGKLYTIPPQITADKVPKLTGKQISDHAKAVINGLKKLYPNTLMGIYTGYWFIFSYSIEMESWIGNYPAWFAHYYDTKLGTRNVTWEQLDRLPPWPFTVSTPPGIDWDIWQFTSTIITPAQNARYDWNVYKGTLDQMLSWVGKTGEQMTTLYNTAVAQKDRAKILELKANQKLTVTPKELGIDAVILPMGGMDKWDGNHKLIYTEPTFSGRFTQFNSADIPVIGKFNLDAGYWLKESHTAPEVDNMPLKDNYVLKALIDAWYDGNWTWDIILSKQGKWKNIKALIMSMVEVDGYPTGTTISDDWQARTFKHMFNHVKYLIDNGYAPNIPLILYTGPWWLSMYKVGMVQEINNRKDWLYLDLGQWVLFSTGTFNTLAEILAYTPSDAFSFFNYPDGYFERILLHEFTAEYQKSKTIVDVDGNPSAVSLSLWNDTKESMYNFLKVTNEPTTPPVTNPDLTEILTRLDKIEGYLEKLVITPFIK